MSPDEQRLSDALQQEAARVPVAPDGLARIQQRVAAPVVRPVRRRRITFAVSVVGLAAALALVVGIGLRPDATPRPVDSPGPLPTAGPSYQPQPGRTTVDVYRVRSGGTQPLLAIEPVRVTPPYAPRQALDALFGLEPLDDADRSPLVDDRNVVASTAETQEALLLDMSSVYQVSRAPSRAVAELWVQAWVRTLQSAYSSDLPVLITLNGRPTTLYGVVDTSRPIVGGSTMTFQDQRIFLPRPGEQVTSPVELGAHLPKGTFTWRVYDSEGRQVGEDATREGEDGYSGITRELPPGRYEGEVTAVPTSNTRGFRRTVDFEVTGTAPPAAPAPVSDPATTPLTTVPVYWAGTDDGLVGEVRTSRAATDVLSDYFAQAPSGAEPEVSALDARNRVGSVTQTDSRLTVDFDRLEPGKPGVPAAALARQAAAFARTVQSVAGTELPVAVTEGGEPASLLGVPAGEVLPTAGRVRTDAGPYAQAPRDPGRAEIVGRLDDPRQAATYELADAVSQQTRYQGAVPPADPQSGVYAFSIGVPAGRYLLTVTTTEAGGTRGSIVTDLVVS